MPALINWNTTLSALDAALLTASATDQITGAGVRARLETYGLTYDRLNTIHRAQMDADEAAFEIEENDWKAVLIGPGGFFDEADAAIRYAERLFLDWQTGRVLDPTIATLNDGTTYVLAPTVALPFDPSEAEPTRASLTLDNGTTPILRVRARELGIGGIRVQLQVANAGDGKSEHFLLRAKLGAHEWMLDDIDASQPLTIGETGLLIESIEHVGFGRADNLELTNLGQGTGRALATLQERSQRAIQLPTTTLSVRSAIEKWVQRTNDQWARRPTYVSPIAQRESELTVAIAETVAFIAYLAR